MSGLLVHRERFLSSVSVAMWSNEYKDRMHTTVNTTNTNIQLQLSIGFCKIQDLVEFS